MSGDIPVLIAGLVLVSLVVVLIALRPRRPDLSLPREDDLELDPDMLEPAPDRRTPDVIDLPAREIRREPPAS